jgi:hypothetical protein
MKMQLAERLASEYLRLIVEGWEPDLEEFLGRVPDAHRERCRERIEGVQGVAGKSALTDVVPALGFLFEEHGPEMKTRLPERLASEYLRLIDEGWEPDLEEFLGRVPEALRERCRARIEGVQGIAEEPVLPDEEPEPELPEDEFAVEVPTESHALEPERLEELASAKRPGDEPAQPKGPQRLTKQEAMALWDTLKRS